MSDIQQSKILCQKKSFQNYKKNYFVAFTKYTFRLVPQLLFLKKKSKKFPNLIPIILHTYPIIDTKKQIVIGAFEP